MPWDYTKPQWDFLLTTASGTKLADLGNARERSLHFALNRPEHLSFKLDLTDFAVPALVNNVDCLILAYKQGVLQMVAEVATMQVVGDENQTHSLMVVAPSAAWPRLQKSLIGQSSAGIYFDADDRAAIVWWALEGVVNPAKYTGVTFGTSAATSTVNAGPWYYKPLLEVLQELSADAVGFDFWFTPVQPTAGNSYRVAELHCHPLRGTTKPNAIFEYGHGRHNAASYEWMIDLQGRLTRAVSLPPTYPNNLGLPVKTSVDVTTEGLPGQPRREEVVQTDLVDEALRQSLMDEHVAVRKNPRSIYQIQPHIDDGTGRTPVSMIDYGIGDIVTSRVKDSNVLLLDGEVRVYGIDIDIDDQGLEKVTLTLIDES